ncbi:MAG: glycosyltransferase family 2 protein [Gammaproteobacteria bacterium]|nr:glycosyltransferase family 2 protein [Gammaproteobacteria bacterium]
MTERLRIGAVIPARDEEDNIGAVVRALRALRTRAGDALIDDIVVCDNGSADATGQRARDAGARVVNQQKPGYGIACLTAIAALADVDVVLFVDGDQSFDTSQASRLHDAIAQGADLAIGSRVLGRVERGALSAPQIAGNRVAGILIRLLWKARVTDLGPFRAIRSTALAALDMRDTAYGWTVEMQIKAIQQNMRVVEVPVDTRRRRHGKSKVGGTVRGVAGASIGITGMILKLALRSLRARHLRSNA